MSFGHIERLERIIRAPVPGSEREIKLALTSLLAELRERKSGDAEIARPLFQSALRSLERIRGASHSELRMECLKECSQYFYLSSLSGESLGAVTSLLRLAQIAQSPRWIRLAENFAGVINAELGNVADALAHYLKAIELARSLDDFSSELGCTLNLGVALNYASLYSDAVRCFQRVENLAGTQADTRQYVATAATNLAQSFLQLGEFDAGLDAVERALALSSEPDDATSALSRVIREFTYVRLALETKKFGEAKVHAQACHRYAIQSGTAKARFHATVTLALCEVYSGNSQHGLMALKNSLRQCGDMSAEAIDVLTLLVKAHDEIGQPSEALECMKALMDYIRTARGRAIQTLLRSSASGAVSRSPSDLQALHLTEASLRARAAEKELFDSRLEMLERLALTADLKEDISGQHGVRVGRLSALLAQKLEWSHSECSMLEGAGRLHDIGKMGIPDRILFATEELQTAQRKLMTAHTTIGAEILSSSAIPQLRLAEDVCRFHHAWWNGSGYPSSRAGERIPVSARIVALADVFDALTHGRPYSEAWTSKAALAEIERGRGTQFDPEIASVFLNLVQDLLAKHSDLDAYLTSNCSSPSFLVARQRIYRILSIAKEGRGDQSNQRAEAFH